MNEWLLQKKNVLLTLFIDEEISRYHSFICFDFSGQEALAKGGNQFFRPQRHSDQELAQVAVNAVFPVQGPVGIRYDGERCIWFPHRFPDTFRRRLKTAIITNPRADHCGYLPINSLTRRLHNGQEAYL